MNTVRRKYEKPAIVAQEDLREITLYTEFETETGRGTNTGTRRLFFRDL